MGKTNILDVLVYVLSGVGVLQFIGIVVMFFIRSYFTRIHDDIKAINAEVDKLWEEHNRCDIDKVTERTAFLARELERLEDRVNGKLNGKNG